MPNLLDDHSALHNFKQREGLNPVKAESVSDYILERRLIRTLHEAMDREGCMEMARKTGLGPVAVSDVVEQYCYCLKSKDLRIATGILDEEGIYPCIRFIHSLGDPDCDND